MYRKDRLKYVFFGGNICDESTTYKENTAISASKFSSFQFYQIYSSLKWFCFFAQQIQITINCIFPIFYFLFSSNDYTFYTMYISAVYIDCDYIFLTREPTSSSHYPYSNVFFESMLYTPILYIHRFHFYLYCQHRSQIA